MSNTENAGKRLELRKYANRRYYDSTHSRHLTLEEIRTLVEQGHDIRVMDARTKADITAQVLVQIILELDTIKLDSLPVPLLLYLIRLNDHYVRSFLENHLYRALQSFNEYQKQWQEQMRSFSTLPNSFPGAAAWNAMFQPFAPPRPEGGAAAGDSNAELREMVHRLQQQVQDLQQRYPHPARKRPSKRKRASSK